MRAAAIALAALWFAGAAQATDTASDRLLQAARSGSAEALADLATDLQARSDPADRLVARACLELAAEAGHTPAKTKLAALTDPLSPADRSAVDLIKARYLEAYGVPTAR